MTSPAYLRNLALTYERSPTPARLETARRLHEIAGELDELQAGTMAVMGTRAPNAAPRDLATGTTRALEKLRAHQAAAPTPAELAEIRGIVGGHRRAR